MCDSLGVSLLSLLSLVLSLSLLLSLVSRDSRVSLLCRLLLLRSSSLSLDQDRLLL